MVTWRESLAEGQVIPACPLTLHVDGRWSAEHQAAVVRYYAAAGAGGVAVGVHSTQFAIRDPAHGLFEPLLTLAADVLDDPTLSDPRFIRICGICGPTRQALREAQLAADLGYHAGLLSMTSLSNCAQSELIEHARRVSLVIPVVGFYLQPAVGGRVLDYAFWRQLCDLDNVVAIKIAPFNRYFTGDVIRAVIDSGRDDIALYTGNDDNIIGDLLTPFEFSGQTRNIVGGLLGQWGVWTRSAVDILNRIREVRGAASIPSEWLSLNAALTDLNAAVFDAANSFAGCIPGINEVLRRQGLSPSGRCLNASEVLSAGQAKELDRVTRAYPQLVDDDFVREHIDEWIR